MLADNITSTKWILQSNIKFDTNVLAFFIPKNIERNYHFQEFKKGLKLNLQENRLLHSKEHKMWHLVICSFICRSVI